MIHARFSYLKLSISILNIKINLSFKQSKTCNLQGHWHIDLQSVSSRYLQRISRKRWFLCSKCHTISHIMVQSQHTVHPKKYAHGLCIVLCCRHLVLVHNKTKNNITVCLFYETSCKDPILSARKFTQSIYLNVVLLQLEFLYWKDKIFMLNEALVPELGTTVKVRFCAGLPCLLSPC